jgi:inorganic phosphate transporter, PiT family
VLWAGLVQKVLIPASLAPLVAVIVAFLASSVTRFTAGRVDQDSATRGFRWGQIASSSLLSVAHGTNDAQKTMGVVTLALIANGTLAASGATPSWVVVLCAIAMGLGTFFGGWRIIRTMGKGITDMTFPQGFASQVSASAVILTSSHLGLPLSTTHVATGSIVGAGLSAPQRPVRWRLIGSVAVAWVTTFPAAALFGAVAYEVAHLVGAGVGETLMGVLAALYCGTLMVRSRRHQVHADNVNDQWTARPGSRAGTKKDVAS